MKVGSFRRDSKAMREGEWVSPGPEFGEVEIKTRAMLPLYYDELAARTAREARRVGGEAKIGMSFRNEVIVQCLIKYCLQDIRGLEHNDGRSVSFAEFCDMISDEEYSELATMAIQATSQVGRARDEDLADAAKNLQSPLIDGLGQGTTERGSNA